MELERDPAVKEPSAVLSEDIAGKYNAFLENIGSSACRFIFDNDLTLLYANNSFFKSTGYTKKEFLSHFGTRTSGGACGLIRSNAKNLTCS